MILFLEQAVFSSLCQILGALARERERKKKLLHLFLPLQNCWIWQGLLDDFCEVLQNEFSTPFSLWINLFFSLNFHYAIPLLLPSVQAQGIALPGTPSKLDLESGKVTAGHHCLLYLLVFTAQSTLV